MKNCLHALQLITSQVLLVAILAISAPAIHSAQAATIYNSFNTGGVSNGPSAATVFSVSSAANITKIQTYHYNGGSGSTPGTISLKHSDGTVYGPWSATGSAVPFLNWYWNVYPGTTIKSGSYTIIDSNTATWSHNSTSGYAGFVLVEGDVVSVTSILPSAPTNVTAIAGDGSATVSFTPGSSAAGRWSNTGQLVA